MPDNRDRIIDDGPPVVHRVEHDFTGGLKQNGSTISGFTDEKAQDAVGAMVDSTLNYVDATPALGVADGGVDTTQIATDAVTATEIAAGAVDTSEIASGAVNTTELATDAVTSGQIAAGSVDTSELVANAVTANEIATDAVGTSEIDLSISPTWTGPIHTFDAEINLNNNSDLKDANNIYANSSLNVGGNVICRGVEASGSVTLSSGSATVDTGRDNTNTDTYYVALGPSTDDADIAAEVRSDSGTGTYVVDIVETQDTSIGNPTVEYDVIRVR